MTNVEYALKHILDRMETYVETHKHNIKEAMESLETLADLLANILAAETKEAATDINDWLEPLFQQCFSRQYITKRVMLYLQQTR